MYCLANICYVCLEKKSELIRNINSSLSTNKDIIHIIGYLSFNLAWLKSLRIILICEECCLRLRETYQFREKCLKNSALLQRYRDNLSTTPTLNTENEAELIVKLNITHGDINEVNCEIQSEDEDICRFQWHPNIEQIGDVFVDFENSLVKEGIICKKEVDDTQDNNSTEIIEQTEDVFVNVEDLFVKEENSWKQEEVDDAEEYPTGNNSIENIDNESDPEKPYECSKCKKKFVRYSDLVRHMQSHTGEKPYSCSVCKKCFSAKSSLVTHMRIHTAENPYSCARCKKYFTKRSDLVRHMRIHTGEKPYECTKCKKCFTDRSNLRNHLRIHSNEKPYECSECKKCFARNWDLVPHMRRHTGEKPYSCSRCKKCFSFRSSLVRHMQIHTGE